MKPIRLFLTLFLSLFLLAACGAQGTGNAQNDWKVYHAKAASLVNPNFPAYSLEYPSAWAKQEEANHIMFASDAKLLKVTPQKLELGQIIAGLSMNVNRTPEEMIDTYASTLKGTIQFEDAVSVIVNGHPAAYQKGKNSETGDETFVIATDIGENTGGLLTARIAAGEADKWKEILFRIAQSLQLEG